jgi:hypothetical protein
MHHHRAGFSSISGDSEDQPLDFDELKLRASIMVCKIR